MASPINISLLKEKSDLRQVTRERERVTRASLPLAYLPSVAQQAAVLYLHVHEHKTCEEEIDFVMKLFTNIFFYFI